MVEPGISQHFVQTEVARLAGFTYKLALFTGGDLRAATVTTYDALQADEVDAAEVTQYVAGGLTIAPTEIDLQNGGGLDFPDVQLTNATIVTPITAAVIYITTDGENNRIVSVLSVPSVTAVGQNVIFQFPDPVAGQLIVRFTA